MNYYDTFINGLKFAEDSTTLQKSSAIAILRNLIEIYGSDRFNSMYNNYFISGDESFNYKFIQFHKSMRITDFYENHNIDMIFWHLIYTSNVVYDMFSKFYKYVNSEDSEYRDLSIFAKF